MARVLLLSFFISFLFTSFLNGQSITLSNIDEVVQIEQLGPEPFIVADYSFTSDIALSKQEFEYLTDLKIGTQITNQDLARAIAHLFQKNCFETISISLSDSDEGKIIAFILTGRWCFDGLKISGIWVGKDWYKQYYLMEPGDSFDSDKHQHSMQKIKEACQKDGFFKVRIKSKFVRDQKTKLVTVHTAINRGWRFSIDDVSLSLKADESIIYQDQKNLEKQLYKKFLRLNRFGKYARGSLEQQAKGIKEYLAKRGFLLVNIDLTEQLRHAHKSVRLKWHITIGRKRNFVFFGAHFFSRNQLLNRLLKFGRSAWIVPATILADELKDAYRAKGFWDVKIDASDEGNRAIFVITEGERMAIKQIAMNGAQAFSEQKIIKRCFLKVKRHCTFDRQLFDRACEQLIDLYLAHGFLQARIIGHEYVPLGDGSFKLMVNLAEGEQTTIDTIDIADYEHLANQGPFLTFQKKKKPVCYDTALIQEQKRWLIDYFRQKGYLFVQVQSELKEVESKKQLIWHINPGEQIRFGKTIIQGSSTFPFSSVMRELRYKDGDLWDTQKVRKSFMRLKDKNIFDVVSFAPLAMKDYEHERPIMLKYHKDDPFELRARAGLEFQHIRQYQTFGGLTYKLGGTFLVKNPSNNGDYFRFDGDVARSHREVHLKYFYPWFFGVPIGALFHTYAIRYEQPGFIGTKNNIYTIFEHGALVGLRYKGQHVDAGINCGFEVARTKVGDDITTQELAAALAQAIEFDPKLLDKNIPFVFVEPTLFIDHLDTSLNPHKGMFTLISLKGMFPTCAQFANSYFLKLLVEHSWFVPIERAVIAFRFRFGHIFHRCFADIMPNERFYLGGSHSVRSYETDLAPPLGCFIDAKGKKNIVPRGGKTMLNINTELRLPEFNKVGVVIFQDMGILSGDDFIDFNSKNIVGGIGFGVRYFTPIGPLRFDIAWKWRKHVPEEHGYNWFVTFGQAF